MVKQGASCVRIVAVATAVTLTCHGQSIRPDALGPARERAVLAVLRELDFAAVTAARNVYTWLEDTSGNPCLVREARQATGCERAALDRLQRLAERLAAAHGIDWTATPTAGPDALQSPFLGFDPNQRLGWYCSGLRAGGRDWLRTAESQDVDTSLAAERSRATEDGARLCRVHSLQLLEPDGEAMVAATLSDFLGRATGGKPLDLTAVFFAGVQRVAFPLPPALATAPDDDGFVVVETPRRVELTLQVTGAGFERRDPDDPQHGAWLPLREPIPTAGRPTRVQVPLVGKSEGARAFLRVVQGAGRGRVTATGNDGVALLGSTFDATKPFHVDLVLTPGRYRIDPHLLVGLPRP